MKIFISFSHKDENVCVALAKALRGDNHEVFIYEDSISIGESILDKVTESISIADLFIAVITKNYLDSNWTQTELSAAVLRGKGINLFPVVVGDLFVPDSISDIRYLKVDKPEDVVDKVVIEVRRIGKSKHPSDYLKSLPYDSSTESKDEKIGLLKDALSSNQLTLVCGAGVSQDSLIPSWNELLLGILDNAINFDIVQKAPNSGNLNLEDLVKKFPQSNIIVGKYLKQLLGNDFEESVRKLLYKQYSAVEESDLQNINYMGYIPSIKYHYAGKLILAIAELARPKRTGKRLESIITFNFDDLIEGALRSEAIDCCPIWKEGQRSTADVLPIYHVHGYLPKAGELDNPNLVFSEDAYHSQFIDPFSWSNLIQLNTYSKNVCLFVGLSLVDPNLRRLLDISHRKNNDRKNYIIMRKDTRDNRINEIYSTLFEQDANSLGLNVLWVSEYSEIPEFLKKIVK